MPTRHTILSPQEIKAEAAQAKEDERVAAATELANLTPKQKALAREMLRNPGGTAIEQAKAAGYKVAEGSKPNHLKKNLSGKLSNTLKEFGIFEDDLAKVAADGLTATHVRIVKVSKRDAEGKLIGEEVEYHEIPDYVTRLATFKTLCALGDYFPAKKLDIKAQLAVGVFTDVDPEILAARKRELMERGKEAIDAEFTVEPS